LEISHEIGRIAARAHHRRYAVVALLGEALAQIRHGDLDGAETTLGRATAQLSEEVGPLHAMMTTGLSATCALRRGRFEQAETLALTTLETINRATWPIAETRYPLNCALDVFLTDGRHERHRATIDAALAQEQRLARRFPFARANAWLTKGRYELLEGRSERATQYLRSSLDAAERLGSRFELALAHKWLARAALSKGGARYVPEGATTHARAALELFERLGCAWESARTRQLF
jgi:tetratricopeptide (TPR) repeat protein